MKYAVLFVLILSSFLGVAQEQSAADPAPPIGKTVVSATDDEVKLEIENVGKKKVSEALIQRIFRETVHEVAWQLNPQHPPRILAHVKLRLGAPGFTIETVEGRARNTVMNMQEWDEFAFARMVARAARNGLFTDQELDTHARSGLTRARATTSVSELQHR